MIAGCCCLARLVIEAARARIMAALGQMGKRSFPAAGIAVWDAGQPPVVRPEAPCRKALCLPVGAARKQAANLVALLRVSPVKRLHRPRSVVEFSNWR